MAEDQVMRFTKMHGAGNDYIYVDCFAEPIPADPPALARAISHRHFGVGADGLILICPIDGADAEMRMFNADGSASEMCGNGIRCVAKYVYDHGIAKKQELKIASAGTVYALELIVENGTTTRVRVDMGEPILDAPTIPTTLELANGPSGTLAVDGVNFQITPVSMGNPHAVIFVQESLSKSASSDHLRVSNWHNPASPASTLLTDHLVHHFGPLIENDTHFPRRVNVEFIEVLSRTEIRQRTWERGSGETLACGTGASAVCVAGVLCGVTDRTILNHLAGGDLELSWSESDNHVYMTGPAEEIFSGTWDC